MQYISAYTFSTLFCTVLFIETAFNLLILVIVVHLSLSETVFQFATQTGVRWCRQ